MDDVKRLGYPAAIIALSALIVKLFQQYIHIPYQTTVITIIIVLALFLFGMSLNKSRKRRNPSIFKKILAILIMVLLLLIQLGYIRIALIAETFQFFGIDAFFINMIYIFCGYLFAD